jgi:hypothetical protein
MFANNNSKRKSVCKSRSVTARINRLFLILCCFTSLPNSSWRQRNRISQIENEGNGSYYLTFFVQALDEEEDGLRVVKDGQHSSGSATMQTKPSGESNTSSERAGQKIHSKMSSMEARNVAESKKNLFVRAAVRGLGGGLPGAVAGIIQVLTLMWIRTVVNYQYRYAVSFRQAFAALKAEGGIARFYRGLGFALIQNPLAKFGATAANDSIDVLIEKYPWVGQGRRAVLSSILVALWRLLLMPIDTCKTVLQVDSKEGFRELMRKVRSGKLYLLYEGAIASALSSSLSNWPWFYVYRKLTILCQNRNYLVDHKLIQNAIIGFLASVVSDTTTNVFRVIKTNKQSLARKRSVGYGEAIREILAIDGLVGLFGRGLMSKLLANAIQSVVFTVVWRWLAERWNPTITATTTTVKVDSNTEHQVPKQKSTNTEISDRAEAKKQLDEKLKES